MSEYRIVAKIDPQTSAGADKVKQDLRSIDSVAAQTNRNLDTNVAKPLDAAGKSATGFSSGIREAGDGMRQATSLFKQGSLSIADLAGNLTDLRRPLRDVAQDATEAGGALGNGGGRGRGMGLAGAAGLLGGVVGGLLVSALAAGAAALVDMAIKAIKGGESVDDLVQKLREAEQQSEKTRQAKEVFGRTLEGVTAALREQREQMNRNAEAEKSQAQRDHENALRRLNELKGIKAVTLALIDQAEARLRAANQTTFGAGGGASANAASQLFARQLDDLNKLRATTDARIAEAQSLRVEALGLRLVENAQAQATSLGTIKDKYDGPNGLIAKARQQATASEVMNGTLDRRIRLLIREREEEERIARERAKKPPKGPGDGVTRFRSQADAIGVAGRELQGQGLRVDGNTQFGYTSGHANDAVHNKIAIDVNAGKGVNEASHPDLKAKFDRLARLYQSRGYKVLWAGYVYDAGKNGPSRPIQGAGKHFDHMHLEAPSTIVGQPTLASTAAQQFRDDAEGEAAAKRAADTKREQGEFVDRIVAQQATRGLDAGPESLNARMERIVTDYKGRFNGAIMSAADQKTIRDALIGGDAAETSKAFHDAYIAPLERLQVVAGLTGEARQVALEQFDAAKKSGEQLSDIEKGNIQNSIQQTNSLERQAAILAEINRPLEEYKAQIAALNKLLADGSISAERYNAEMARMKADTAGQVLGGLRGADPATGVMYEDIIAQADERSRFATQLADLQSNREQMLALGISYNEMERAIYQEHVDRMNEIDQARRDVNLGHMADMAGSVTSIMRSAFGEQSRIARAAFVAEKAIAIARAGIALAENVAQASKIGFPQNLPFIAGALAQGATIMASLRSAGAAFQGEGYRDGGYTGDGGRDSPAGVVHGQEFVVNAEGTRQNRALLEAINSGRRGSTGARQMAGVMAGSAPMVVPAPQVGLRVINVIDKGMVKDFFETAEGEQVFVNLMQRNSDVVERVASGGSR